MSKFLTIDQVVDLKTGRIFESEDLLSQDENKLWDWRIEQKRKIIRNKGHGDVVEGFGCAVCKHPVFLSGGKKTSDGIIPRRLHFKHHRDSPDCYIKTNFNGTKRDIEIRKWCGQREGEDHKDLKRKIVKSLESEPKFLFAVEEKRLTAKDESKNWRRPDVWAQNLAGDQFVFEIQLSTTFIDVVLERELFYQNEGIYLVWIFDQFSTFPSQQSFTEKDIFYANNCNAFVINDETMKKSLERNELYLECHFKKPIEPESCNEEIEAEWCKEIVSFSQLKRDPESFSLYFFNYRSARSQIENKLKREKEIQQEEYNMRWREKMIEEMKQENASFQKSKQEPVTKKYSWAHGEYKCEVCGELTTDWSQGTPDTKTCICRKCV